MKIRQKYYVYSFIIFCFVVFYFIDKEFFMKKRIMSHEMWDHESGYIYKANGKLRDLIHTDCITSFKNDTMVFDYSKEQDTLVLKWQYFSTMKVSDPKTGKTAKYSMKGANWMDYLFK